MTDEQIVKALQRCFIVGSCSGCTGCPLKPKGQEDANCIDKLVTNTIDLINRQQAEIERLKEWNNIKIDEMRQERQEYFENNKKYRADIEEKYEKMFLEAEAQIRPKAIKEFAVEVDNMLAEMRDEYHKFGEISYGLVCETVHTKLAMLTKEKVGADDA